MRYDAAIFDLDGTILDTIDDLAASLNHALDTCGLPRRTRGEVLRFVGNGIRRTVEQGVPPGTDAETVDKAYEAFVGHYLAHCLDETKPYPGIPEALAALKAAGCPAAVVSNKDDAAVRKLVERFLPGLFAYTVGTSGGIRKKPAPDTVLAACGAMGVSPDRCVYIGDSEVDIQTARNAGMPCVIVLWGFREKGFLAERGAEVFAETPADLPGLLLDQ